MLKKLKDECYIVMGQSPSSEFYNCHGEGVPFMQGRKTFGYKYPVINVWTTKPSKMGVKDSILMSVRAPVGDVNIAERDVCIGRGLASIKMRNGNNQYLYYLLKNNVEKIKKKSSGTVFEGINRNDLENLVLDFHDAEIQNKIVKILSILDNKIEVNTQINNSLQELLNKVFTNWFCEYDYPNETDQPYKSSGGKMIESELGEIPENWRIGLFQDIIDFSNGYGFKSNDLLDKEEKETYKVFKQGNINLSGGINEEKTKSWFYKDNAKGLEKFILKKGDILMCMTDMKNSTSPLLGHTALMNVDDEYIVNQRVGLIRCKKEITDYPYVYTMSNLEYFLRDIRSRANSGVQVNLSTNGICETKIIIPSKTILDKFNNFAKPLYEIMFNNQKENRVLEQLRDTLLPKLMNGEIDLDNIEI